MISKTTRRVQNYVLIHVHFLPSPAFLGVSALISSGFLLSLSMRKEKGQVEPFPLCAQKTDPQVYMRPTESSSPNILFL